MVDVYLKKSLMEEFLINVIYNVVYNVICPFQIMMVQNYI